jgi:hypothetical protein
LVLLLQRRGGVLAGDDAGEGSGEAFGQLLDAVAGA